MQMKMLWILICNNQSEGLNRVIIRSNAFSFTVPVGHRQIGKDDYKIDKGVSNFFFTKQLLNNCQPSSLCVLNCRDEPAILCSCASPQSKWCKRNPPAYWMGNGATDAPKVTCSTRTSARRQGTRRRPPWGTTP